MQQERARDAACVDVAAHKAVHAQGAQGFEQDDGAVREAREAQVAPTCRPGF
jgi:hypothetical protein